MLRGTFANVRIKNTMVSGVEGGVYTVRAGGEQMSIYDAAMKYRSEGTPLVIIWRAGVWDREFTRLGGQRNALMGVKAVIVRSFERIHRSNLVGMGVLPLQFKEGTSAETLALDGTETFDIAGLSGVGVRPRQDVILRIHRSDGTTTEAELTLRIDTPIELEYYLSGGILPFVLKQLVAD